MSRFISLHFLDPSLETSRSKPLSSLTWIHSRASNWYLWFTFWPPLLPLHPSPSPNQGQRDPFTPTSCHEIHLLILSRVTSLWRSEERDQISEKIELGAARGGFERFGGNLEFYWGEKGKLHSLSGWYIVCQIMITALRRYKVGT